MNPLQGEVEAVRNVQLFCFCVILCDVFYRTPMTANVRVEEDREPVAAFIESAQKIKEILAGVCRCGIWCVEPLLTGSLQMMDMKEQLLEKESEIHRNEELLQTMQMQRSSEGEELAEINKQLSDSKRERDELERTCHAASTSGGK